jgi:hypothetical protein
MIRPGRVAVGTSNWRGVNRAAQLREHHRQEQRHRPPRGGGGAQRPQDGNDGEQGQEGQGQIAPDREASRSEVPGDQAGHDRVGRNGHDPRAGSRRIVEGSSRPSMEGGTSAPVCRKRAIPHPRHSSVRQRMTVWGRVPMTATFTRSPGIASACRSVELCFCGPGCQRTSSNGTTFPDVGRAQLAAPQDDGPAGARAKRVISVRRLRRRNRFHLRRWRPHRRR